MHKKIYIITAFFITILVGIFIFLTTSGIKTDNFNGLINEKVKILIMIGDNKDILNTILDVNTNKVCYGDLEKAMSYVFSVMLPGDPVLMSPGTSSYYMYDNYQHRGNHFKELVKRYASQKN